MHIVVPRCVTRICSSHCGKNDCGASKPQTLPMDIYTRTSIVARGHVTFPKRSNNCIVASLDLYLAGGLLHQQFSVLGLPLSICSNLASTPFQASQNCRCNVQHTIERAFLSWTWAISEDHTSAICSSLVLCCFVSFLQHGASTPSPPWRSQDRIG